MFGFSIQKILFTVAAIAIIWWGFKWLGRVQAQKKELAREKARRMKREGTRGSSAKGAEPAVEEMIECPECGVFVAASGARHCGKADCPYPG